MRDADVRTAVLSALGLQYEGDHSTRIVEEMGIWSGSVRIDVAVINGKLHGYELKSARDTLDRLAYQSNLYSQVFDHVTLVTAERHYSKARDLIPNWWGITLALWGNYGPVDLKQKRSGRENKHIVPIQLARLLWKDEAIQVLERFQIARGVRGANAETIFARLAERLPLPTLKEEVRATLKRRVGWLGQPIGNKRDVAVHSHLHPNGPVS